MAVTGQEESLETQVMGQVDLDIPGLLDYRVREDKTGSLVSEALTVHLGLQVPEALRDFLAHLAPLVPRDKRAAVATGIKERKETRYAWFAAELKLRHLSVTLHPPPSLLSLANEFVCTFFDMMRM
ncbi:hypothetical protein D4764_03G0005790 [Takifugu flavidus]|uniref:Uncharacterized protein n=1 Tax=Takifugu flavidus TaxID=433684 RepID=A0A5C6NAV8_9TELE|nr:hypothetical protein D4764_03G0005790 [Takifugu flavidus]